MIGWYARPANGRTGAISANDEHEVIFARLDDECLLPSPSCDDTADLMALISENILAERAG
jgi:hypothetical protein